MFLTITRPLSSAPSPPVATISLEEWNLSENDYYLVFKGPTNPYRLTVLSLQRFGFGWASHRQQQGRQPNVDILAHAVYGATFCSRTGLAGGRQGAGP